MSRTTKILNHNFSTVDPTDKKENEHKFNRTVNYVDVFNSIVCLEQRRMEDSFIDRNKILPAITFFSIMRA